MSGYVASKEFFRRYPNLITMLYNVHHHMKELKYDYPLIICGKTGNGKSMLELHIIDLWYNLILNEKLTPQHIKHVQNTRQGWIKNFKNIRPLDINANDEGADGLMSKESVTRFGRDIQKLYNVFRKKLFLTIICIPDFFDLPPYFRKRVRGVIFVHRRGCFKYYTGQGVEWLNARNENKNIKRMEYAYPYITGTFPDYQGVLRDGYDLMANDSSDTILDEMINEIDLTGSVADAYYDKVVEMIDLGVTQKDIAKELHISTRDISNIRKKRVLLDK